MKYLEILKKKIKNKSLKVGVIGLGYVGLPLLIQCVKKNFFVYGFDNDSKKINMLLKGKSYIKHINQKEIKNIKSNKIIFTNNFSKLKEPDLLIICLPTPINKNLSPDMRFLMKAKNYLNNFCREGQIIVLESTTYPGTCEEIFKPVLDKFVLGKGAFLGYSPEREDPGNKNFNIENTTKIVSGYTKNCRNLVDSFYSKITKKTFPTTTLKVAEMTKLYENIFRSINIGLVNEMKLALDKMGINILEVINAAKTKPFGFMPFYPGPGLGGHCIPIDPFIMAWKAKQNGAETKFIELSGKINRKMPTIIFKKVLYHLRKLKDPRILILGLSYKKNIDDARESPSFELMKLFHNKKFKIDYHDKYFSKLPKMRNYDMKMRSVKINTYNLKKYNAVIVMTDHDYIDYNLIQKNSEVIFDSRGRFKKNKKVIYV